MAVLEILEYPDPRLTQVSQPVTEFSARLRRFLADLDATRRAAPGCVGIAAPQVGHFERIVIIDVSGRKKTNSNGHLVLINPEITHWDGYGVGREGCLSVPDYTGNVIRAEQITLHAYGPDGGRFELSSAGFEARAIQHEIDHLDGLLFLDRLVSRRTDLFTRKVYQK